MPERTTRGQEDRQREDKEIQGQPVNEVLEDPIAAPVGSVTRDRDIEPAKDTQGDGHGQERNS